MFRSFKIKASQQNALIAKTLTTYVEHNLNIKKNHLGTTVRFHGERNRYFMHILTVAYRKTGFFCLE